MPSPPPVVGSADRPSAAHSDPYHSWIAAATSTCQSNALTSVTDLMEMIVKREASDSGRAGPACLWVAPPVFTDLMYRFNTCVCVCVWICSTTHDAKKEKRRKSLWQKTEEGNMTGKHLKVRGAAGQWMVIVWHELAAATCQPATT